MPKSKKTEINNILPEDKPIHDWYRFVLSYPPHLVKQYINKFGIDRGAKILDPFCGTGTTMVECKKHGIASIGVESNPMAFFASQTKLNWDVEYEKFLKDCKRIEEKANNITEKSGISFFTDLPLFEKEKKRDVILRDLPEEQWKVLSKDFISPLPLHRTLILLDEIRSGEKKCWTPHQELALAKALVTSIGNIAFGPEIGATKPKADVPVISDWIDICKQIYGDLKNINKELIDVESSVFFADARQQFPIEKSSIDFVITSPPYPNEKDYTRTTRLESVILGFIKSRKDLKQLKQSLLRSNTRNVFIADQDDKWIEGFESITSLAKQIEDRRIELGKTSGFERLYHRVVLLYFGGMKRHLESMKLILKPGARLAYVVGDQMSYFRIPIRTGTILAEIAESLGYKVDSIDLWRTRLATATKEWIREEVVVLSAPTASA